MKKTQIIFLIVGIILIGTMYSLPRMVVDNSNEGVPMEETDSTSTATSIAETHEPVLTSTERETVNSLKASLDSEQDREKFTI